MLNFNDIIKVIKYSKQAVCTGSTCIKYNKVKDCVELYKDRKLALNIRSLKDIRGVDDVVFIPCYHRQVIASLFESGTFDIDITSEGLEKAYEDNKSILRPAMTEELFQRMGIAEIDIPVSLFKSLHIDFRKGTPFTLKLKGHYSGFRFNYTGMSKYLVVERLLSAEALREKILIIGEIFGSLPKREHIKYKASHNNRVTILPNVDKIKESPIYIVKSEKGNDIGITIDNSPFVVAIEGEIKEAIERDDINEVLKLFDCVSTEYSPRFEDGITYTVRKE